MLIELLRLRQYYKNLVIFLPIIFAGKLFNLNEFFIVLAGFVCLCLMSSCSYIINDIVDKKRDIKNPEKSLRPIAAGEISGFNAFLVSCVLFVVAFFMALQFNKEFLFAVLGLFVLMQFYTFFFRNLVIADVMVIAIGFVLRAVSGAFILNVEVSSWLILCTFFLSLFLSASKRAGELRFSSLEYRNTLKNYTRNLTSMLMNVSTSLLVISYSLYSFLGQYPKLILTLPFALYVVFRYAMLAYKGDFIARHPEKLVKDLGLIIGVLLWVVMVVGLLYL